MIKEVKTDKMLKDARNKVIVLAAKAQKAGNIEQKIAWEQRKLALDAEIERFKAIEEYQMALKRVFVSYSQRSGTIYFQHLIKLLQDKGFEIATGFEESGTADGNILKTVLNQVRRSNLYIGILSRDMEVVSKGGTKWSPSVWVMEEKGMALALEKPFLLLVHKDIHDDFWKKTTPDRSHIFFEDSNFYEKAEEAVSKADERYYQYMLRKLEA